MFTPSLLFWFQAPPQLPLCAFLVWFEAAPRKLPSGAARATAMSKHRDNAKRAIAGKADGRLGMKPWAGRDCRRRA